MRVLIALCGLAVLIWMSVEDTSVVPPVALGLSISLLVAAFQFRKNKTLHWGLLVTALFGAAVGLGTAFAAALLMLLKTGWHGHIVPDYPLGMLLDVLRRAPAWAAAGGLAGLGLGFLGFRLAPK